MEFAVIARMKIANELKLIKENEFQFCWIVDYPMYQKNIETNKIEFSHNPFSMPQGGLDALEKKDPLDIKAYQYDIVCNGVELSSGAIRNHKPEIMIKAFEIAGYTKKDLEIVKDRNKYLDTYPQIKQGLKLFDLRIKYHRELFNYLAKRRKWFFNIEFNQKNYFYLNNQAFHLNLH